MRTLLRPDGRLFVNFGAADRAEYRSIVEAVAASSEGSLYTIVDAGRTAAVKALRGAGFQTEVETENFLIPFAHALAVVDRAWIPSGFEIEPASAVDEDRLFTLDTALRQDVPGTDGWRGDREMFHDELADPAAYLVAIREADDEYVGLVRIWRNPDGPRFGLVGVVREHRKSPLAAALLKEAAAKWGYPAFTSGTSVSNRETYPRMKRLGAASLGRQLQMVRR